MPDVDIRRGKEPQRFGFTATAIPEANGSQTGVSVENAQSETKQWYVLRVSYGRAEKSNELLTAKGIETHLPLHTVYKRGEWETQKATYSNAPQFPFCQHNALSIRITPKVIPRPQFHLLLLRSLQ